MVKHFKYFEKIETVKRPLISTPTAFSTLTANLPEPTPCYADDFLPSAP
jgi:hypothetical protein